MNVSTIGQAENGITSAPPSAATYRHLRPQTHFAFLYTALWLTVTSIGIRLSLVENAGFWLTGQFLLGFAMLHWFIYLHEAGHQTLFPYKSFNAFFGHLAAFFTAIPYQSWRLIHHRHHRWTGWQDMDATTASLVPRELSRIEKVIINFCWKFSIPLFALLYRIQNFWNYPRVCHFIKNPKQRKKIFYNILTLTTLYLGLITIIGFGRFVQLTGLAFLICLSLQELVIMSQHTHIPMRLAQGLNIKPIPLLEQEGYTRSLRFPEWFSRWVLMRMDAHALHHMYPTVPGYRLNEIDYHPNSVDWIQWWKESKKLSGVAFMFSNRNHSGFNL